MREGEGRFHTGCRWAAAGDIGVELEQFEVVTADGCVSRGEVTAAVFQGEDYVEWCQQRPTATG